MNKNHYCVIMAGGIGSRFWPVSRNSVPKQFLDLLGTGKTFIRQTYERFAKIVPKENILVVTSVSYEKLVRDNLPEILPDNILLEPFRKNTAPCVAYATYKLLSKNKNASVVVSPSDHVIFDEEVFTETIRKALDYAWKEDVLITLGVKPTRPETAYGYIQYSINSPVDVNGDILYNIKTFTEKPDASLARIFVDSGEFLWNSGIFVWNLNTIRRELEIFQTGIASLFNKGENIYYTAGEPEFIERAYEDCPSISIDYGIMEKTQKAVVYPAFFGWTDLGTWDSLYVHEHKDVNGNMVKAEKIMLSDVKDSLILSDQPDKLIVAYGLNGYMIINTKDVLMICPRDEITVKHIITDLPLNDLEDYR